jgi:N-acetylneuraminic acid mutarotase
MFRSLPFTLGLLTLAGCGENSSPTQPEMGIDPVPLASSLALASNSWTPKAAFPGWANGVSLGVVTNSAGQSTVYALGGTDGGGGSGASILAYNVATNTWTSKSYEPRVYVYNTNGVGKIGNKLYFSGGYSYAGGSNFINGRFWSYNPGTNTLSEGPRPPKLTADGITGVIEDKLFVLPGTCSTDFYPSPGYCENSAFRRLFRYNPATNLWATKRPAPHYHTNGAGGVINGKFYVAGGTEGPFGKAVAALDRYDPATDSWTTLKPVPTAGPARGAVIQGKLFVVVSNLVSSELGSEFVLRSYAYNPGTNTWSAKAAPKWDHPAAVQVMLDGKPRVFAAGGTWFGVTNESELYTP